jgi:hypothetical protein
VQSAISQALLERPEQIVVGRCKFRVYRVYQTEDTSDKASSTALVRHAVCVELGCRAAVSHVTIGMCPGVFLHSCLLRPHALMQCGYLFLHPKLRML